jgi:ADP-ribose pyrophosphatase YjhB (NUDIX family)
VTSPDTQPAQPRLREPAEERLTPDSRRPLFEVEMRWGQQPVRLTGWRCHTPPPDAPITTVHIVAFHDRHLLAVRDRKGIYGFPGGRLEPDETREAAMAREVFEEANARLEPDYLLYAVLKIECTKRLPNRVYPHAYSYMAMYAGTVRSLEPITTDPAGIIAERALLTPAQCARQLLPHDKVLLREALATLAHSSERHRTLYRAFLES